jgi:hypothetical protein
MHRLVCGAVGSINGIMIMETDDKGEFAPIGGVVSDVVKEIARRAELR